MIQLKEKEISKFLEHDLEKYLKEVHNINNDTDIRKLLHDVFSSGFNSGVKTASLLLKSACKSLE